MDSDIAIIIGIAIGLGVGFGLAYFIFNNKQKLIISRNKDGQIDAIVQE